MRLEQKTEKKKETPKRREKKIENGQHQAWF